LFLTVAVEGGPGGDELHLHPGGQGYWVAQMMRELEVEVTVVAPVGGETGTVLGALVAADGLRLRAVPMDGANGAQLDDGRGDARQPIAMMANGPLTRHDVDELYGAVLVEALEGDVCVLAGSGAEPLLEPVVYQRLAGDLRANDALVVADLSGDELLCALEGGLAVLKASAADLRDDGHVDDDDLESALHCARRLVADGADTAIVTCAERGSIIVHGDDAWTVEAPPLEAVEKRGSGDSLTGGVAAALAQGRSLEDALRLGTAAGALNVTRRGLGSGSRVEIRRLADHVTIEPIGAR
jgi:1-phosphofructokinase